MSKLHELYEKEYEPLGIPKRQVYVHGWLSGIAVIGFIGVSIPLVEPFMHSVGGGLAATAVFCFGLKWLIGQISQSDPAEKKIAQKVEYDRLRSKLLEEVRSGRYLDK